MSPVVTFLIATVAVAPHKNATVTLTWNLNPPTESVAHYNIYELVGSNKNLRGSIGGTQFTIQHEKSGPHTYVVTAINVAGEGPPSNAVAVKI